jgi:hypothetical protein
MVIHNEKEGNMKYAIVFVVFGFTTPLIYSIDSAPILKHAQHLPYLSSTEQINRALYKSVKVHNVGAAEVALALGADVNACDSTTGYTPLIEAVRQDDVGMVRTLLMCGADCGTQDIAGNTVRYYVQLMEQTNPKRAQVILHVLETYAHERK